MAYGQLGNLIFVTFAYLIVGDTFEIQKCFILVAIFDYSVFVFAIMGVCMNAFDDDQAAGKETRNYGKESKKALIELSEIAVDKLIGDDSSLAKMVIGDVRAIAEDFMEEAEGMSNMGDQSSLRRSKKSDNMDQTGETPHPKNHNCLVCNLQRQNKDDKQ